MHDFNFHCLLDTAKRFVRKKIKQLSSQESAFENITFVLFSVKYIKELIIISFKYEYNYF